MNCAIIISEYNPFHLGHQWQLRELRRRGFDCLVAIMSGNFVQRGEPALYPKERRCAMALSGGVDLVLELPLPYACATAERFAFGAVSLADRLGRALLDRGEGCALAFGCEAGELAPLLETVEALENPRLGEVLAPLLKEGLPFAKARALAVEELASSEAAALLGEPNNTLAMEYLLQLRARRSPLEVVALPRRGAGHHDAASCGPYASASAIRQLLREGELAAAQKLVPAACGPLLAEPLLPQERLILARLRTLSLEQLARLPDCSEGLAQRLYAALRHSSTLEEVWQRCKTKRYSHARIRRLCLAAFLGLEKGPEFLDPPYLRVLGFGPRGQELLATLRKDCPFPLSDSLAQLRKVSPQAAAFAALESQATDLYGLFLPQLPPCGEDYRRRAQRLSSSDSGSSKSSR